MLKIIVIIVLILVFPLPVILKINYLDNKMGVYLYFKKVDLERHVLGKLKRKIPFYIRVLDFEFIKLIFRELRQLKLKPNIFFNVKIDYGFEDAYYTGLFYGVFSYLNPIFYHFLQNIYKIKKYNFILNPDYKEPEFKFTIDSIIFINLVKIINILIILIKCSFSRKKIRKSKLKLVKE